MKDCLFAPAAGTKVRHVSRCRLQPHRAYWSFTNINTLAYFVYRSLSTTTLVMSSSAPANRDDQIAQLAGLTGVPPAEASPHRATTEVVEGPRSYLLTSHGRQSDTSTQQTVTSKSPPSSSTNNQPRQNKHQTQTWQATTRTQIPHRTHPSSQFLVAAAPWEAHTFRRRRPRRLRLRDSSPPRDRRRSSGVWRG